MGGSGDEVTRKLVSGDVVGGNGGVGVTMGVVSIGAVVVEVDVVTGGCCSNGVVWLEDAAELMEADLY